MAKRAFLLFILLFSHLAFSQEAPSDSLVYFEVYFPTDQSRIVPEQRTRLDSILERAPLSIVKAIKIYGHTDSLAGIEYNRKLSKNRVLSILQYFVAQGLDPLLAETDYYGEERPKYDNSKEERFRNRRCEVELYIDVGLLPQPRKTIADLNLKKGDKLRIPNLVFVGNQPIPVFESIPTLSELVVLMKTNPDLVVDIQGHVCCTDDMRLSQERARTVYHFLRANGIEEYRMTHRGFSNTKPLFKERTEEERRLNRRVDLMVLENSERRVFLEKEPSIVDLRAPVLDIRFFKETAKLVPSGDFMLDLIAEAIATSENVKYSFTMYNTIGDPVLTKQRSVSLEKQLKRKGASGRKLEVNFADKLPGMADNMDSNLLIVDIKPM